MISLYKITNTLNNKIYIGITKNGFKSRFLSHKRSSKKEFPKQRIHQAMKKHGCDNFVIELIETLDTLLEADIREKYWIEKYNSTNYDIGYNMSRGGVGKSMHWSEEDIERIRASVQAHRDTLSSDEKIRMTKAANDYKRGRKEREGSGAIKSEAQKKRWDNSDDVMRLEHGKKCRNGISDEGKIRAISAMCNAYSPAREKGVMKEKVICPHCGKEGGRPIMGRFHFDNCKSKVDNEYLLFGSRPEDCSAVPL